MFSEKNKTVGAQDDSFKIGIINSFMELKDNTSRGLNKGETQSLKF